MQKVIEATNKKKVCRRCHLLWEFHDRGAETWEEGCLGGDWKAPASSGARYNHEKGHLS